MTISVGVVGILVFFPVVLAGLLGGCIRRSQLVITWWHPIVIGMAFSLHNILGHIGNMGNVVPGELQLLLGKATVVFSMAFGELRCFRGVHVHNVVHVVALVVLVAGFFTGIAGEFDGSGTTSGSGAVTVVNWLLVSDMACVVGSTVPLAFAFVFIEKQLRQTSPNLHPTWLWALVSAVELVGGFAFVYINSSIQGLTPGCVWWNLWEGLACIFGGIDLSTSAGNNTGSNASASTASTLLHGAGRSWPAPSLALGLVANRQQLTAAAAGMWHRQCDAELFGNASAPVSCDRAVLWFNVNNIPGLAFNFAMPVATRYGGATLLWFTRAMALPFAAVLFSLEAVMGSDATPVSVGEVVSILIVGAALSLYELGERVEKRLLIIDANNDLLAASSCCSVVADASFVGGANGGSAAESPGPRARSVADRPVPLSDVSAPAEPTDRQDRQTTAMMAMAGKGRRRRCSCAVWRLAWGVLRCRRS